MQVTSIKLLSAAAKISPKLHQYCTSLRHLTFSQVSAAVSMKLN